MASIRARLLLVRSSSLLSVPTLVVVVVLGLAPVLLVEVVTEQGPVLPWVAIGTLATVCGLVVLVASAALLGRIREPIVNSVLTLVAIAASAVIKVLLVLALAEHSSFAGMVDISERASPVGRLATNVLVHVVIVGVACALVTSQREHRVLRDRLENERLRLISVNQTILDRVRGAEEELREEARLAIEPALAEIRAELESLSQEGSADRALNGLDEAVSTIVRPMSARFADAVPELTVADFDATSLTGARRFRQPVDAPAAVLPWLTTLVLLAAGLLVGSAWRLSAQWFAYLAISAVVWLVVLLAVRHGWPAAWRHLPAFVAFIILAAIYAVLFVGTHAVFGVDDLGPVRGDVTWLGGTYRVATALVISGMAMVQQQRAETDAALEQVNANLRVQMGRLRRESWAIGRRMSLVMHGSVQSALISAMLLLREDSSSDGRQQVLVRLDQARAALDAETQSSGMLAHGLREIARLWSGLCTIDVHLDADTAAQIESDPGLSSCCVEVIREAVGNAVRHGGADMIDVSLAWRDDTVVAITARDNGSGVVDEPRAGLGTRMLDEVCLTWTRTNTGTGTVLSAAIA